MTHDSSNEGREVQRQDEPVSTDAQSHDRPQPDSPISPMSAKRIEPADYRSRAREGFNNYRLRLRFRTSTAQELDESEEESGRRPSARSE